MKLSIETVGRLLASGRNYFSYFLGFATSLGLVSASQSKGLTDSLQEIATGVSQIVHGFTSIYQIGTVLLGPIVSIALAKWASNSAKTDNQVATAVAVANDHTDPAKAEAAKVVLANAAVLAGAEKVVNPAIADNPATLPNVVKS